jgi:hypothetical protein
MDPDTTTNPPEPTAVTADGLLRLANAVAVFARAAEVLYGHADETARQVAVAAPDRPLKPEVSRRGARPDR